MSQEGNQTNLMESSPTAPEKLPYAAPKLYSLDETTIHGGLSSNLQEDSSGTWARGS